MKIRTFLQNADFFKGISDSSIDALVKIAIPKTLNKKEVLFLEGQKGHSLFLLVEGTVQLYKNSIDGREVVIKTIGSGEIFGEVILFEKDSYPVSACAIEKSTVYLMPKRQIVCLFQRAQFRNDFIRMLMEKQRYLTDKILSLSAFDVEERLFKFLREQFGKKDEYPINLTKKDVASAIGVLPETLSRVLMRLKKQNVLVWKENKIYLKRGHWTSEKNSIEV